MARAQYLALSKGYLFCFVFRCQISQLFRRGVPGQAIVVFSQWINVSQDSNNALSLPVSNGVITHVLWSNVLLHFGVILFLSFCFCFPVVCSVRFCFILSNVLYT